MMMGDDNKAAIRIKDIQPKEVIPGPIQRSGRQEPPDANEPGTSNTKFVVMTLPWYLSLGVMTMAILVYLMVQSLA